MDHDGVLRRPNGSSTVVRPAPASPDKTTSPVQRAAAAETARIAVTRSRLDPAQIAVTLAGAHLVLAASHLARARELLADRAPGRDGSHHPHPAQERYVAAGAGPVQACTATIGWIAAIEGLAPPLPDGGAPGDRSVTDPAETTVVSRSPLVTLPMLTRREREVLGYAPSMLSAAEIGTELFVSVNTVKAHLRSIYRKLGVTRRRDAVI